jgi:hypothetical protein
MAMGGGLVGEFGRETLLILLDTPRPEVDFWLEPEKKPIMLDRLESLERLRLCVTGTGDSPTPPVVPRLIYDAAGGRWDDETVVRRWVTRPMPM